jgi:hypothetical protein
LGRERQDCIPQSPVPIFDRSGNELPLLKLERKRLQGDPGECRIRASSIEGIIGTNCINTLKKLRIKGDLILDWGKLVRERAVVSDS